MTGAALIGGIVLAIAAAAAADEDPMRGKHRTEHTVSLEANVAGTPSALYRLWTTADGVTKFFAPKARIDAKPGGEYTILFAPDDDPRGYSHGTFGARVLRAEPGRSLAFEWVAFAGDASLGRNAPPIASRALRDAEPLPTWVELGFEPLEGGRATRVTLHHYGFQDGALWAASHAWFQRAWTGVLESLARYCAEEDRCRE